MEGFLENGNLEETAEQTENTRVQPIRHNGNEGAEAARRQAETIMFHNNLSCWEDNVVKYFLSREEARKFAKEFLEEIRTKWYKSVDSHMQTSECASAANGWKDGCWAYEDVYSELAEGLGAFKQRCFEDDSALPLTNKKTIHWMCKGFLSLARK
uniref:Uncharacterized protein n=1 Tax=Octactis speculum TaxID=3111310 RepID=A0A7S2GTA3_9STRA|mmetsp:Transcript_55499/g.75788  ORF Transcript_55499/g.75788 Transcript_55499/m.75788 type:complete len:155 (+) Transcript_55499:131-595(+)